MSANDLFSANEPEFSATPAFSGTGRGIKWRLVTNHLNMMYMLAAGLLIPPQGFGKKYYADTLALAPGWIPLFPDSMPESAINHSLAESSTLLPCYAELSLAKISGPVKILCGGEWSDRRFPGEINGDEDLILVPAPLPVTMITEIVFRSKEEKMACEKSAKDFGNVPLADFKLKAGAAVYRKATKMEWPPVLDNISKREVPLSKPDALGGMLTILAHTSNRYDLAIAAYKSAYSAEALQENLANSSTLANSSSLANYPILAGISSFADPSFTGTNKSSYSSAVFWRIAERLAGSLWSQDHGSPEDLVLDELQKSGSGLDTKGREASERFIDQLRKLVLFADRTATELLESHQKPLPRAVVLFFLRDDAVDFLQHNHPLLRDYEVSAAAILFGIKDGWMRLPLDLREQAGLNLSVPHVMAQCAHKLASSELNLGQLPERPQFLRELFKEKPWNKLATDAALYLARACKWDCIRTRITLGKGNYQLEVGGSGLHVLLDGDVKAVEAEVDTEGFFSGLTATTEISLKVDQAVRKILKV